ncbi:MAG: YggU family protein [Sulfurospirillum sp.]|nr:MAG: YggU family protein [Sulfurospirillum sp.]
MWYEVKEDFVTFRIKAVPNSSKNVVSGILDDALKLKIKAPAVEGAANKELVKFLSKLFKVSKSEVVFVGGETSKQKRIRLPYNEKVKLFIEEIEKES